MKSEISNAYLEMEMNQELKKQTKRKLVYNIDYYA